MSDKLIRTSEEKMESDWDVYSHPHSSTFFVPFERIRQTPLLLSVEAAVVVVVVVATVGAVVAKL